MARNVILPNHTDKAEIPTHRLGRQFELGIGVGVGVDFNPL
jgi:hypothetical protein